MVSKTLKHPKVLPNSRVTARLIAGLKRLISTRVLIPGAKLPPERELAKQFSVNRASVRQALKVLEIMGVLSQRVGDGTYLSATAETILQEPLDFLILLDDLSHHELFEARQLVEPELAARAAERATAEDLVALRNSIRAMESSQTDQARLESDMAFHDAIFRAAGNRICYLLFGVIHRTLIRSMALLCGRVELDRPLSYHKAIYEAVYNRESERARQKMLEHIQDARMLLVESKNLSKTRLSDLIIRTGSG